MLAQAPASNLRIGLDLSNEALQLARTIEHESWWVRGDMLSLPFPDASFDVVLFCGMLEVPPRAHKVAAIQEVARVLRPHGILYLTTLNRRYPRYHRHPGVLMYEELAALIRPNFDAVIRGFNPIPPFPWGVPNRVLARVPGIWRLLEALMTWGMLRQHSCAFLVKAIKR